MRKQKRQVRQTSVSRIKSLTPKRIKGRPAYLVLQSSKIKRNSRHQLGVVQSFKTTTLIPMVSSFTFPIQNIQNATGGRYPGYILYFRTDPSHTTYSGWWLTYPSDKYEFVRLDHHPNKIGENKKCVKPPTSIIHVYKLDTHHSSPM